jgi:transcriptional regulator with XRE-family HTH domain
MSSEPEPDEPAGVHQRLAVRVRGLRMDRGLSLDALATRSGVSRSMISLVERGEASPTAVVLEKLATGLDVPLASLFEAHTPSTADPVARQTDQPPWRDPASGYLRRNVSPAGSGSPIQIVDVLFPAGARVAYETGAREPRVHQQVWVLQGVIEVSVGDRTHRLDGGDCLALDLDQPVMFHNPTDEPTRYAVVLVSQRSQSR